MQPSEAAGLHCLAPLDHLFTSHFNRLANQIPLYNFQVPPPSSLSKNSTSDDADEQQFSSMINERKKRRMISNRESARRSRMRKQRHLDELWSQVVWLRNENQRIMDKLNHVSESHDRAIEENAQLKKEASELRNMITDMQITSPYPTLRDLEDLQCNPVNNYPGAESSNQSMTSSSDILS